MEVKREPIGPSERAASRSGRRTAARAGPEHAASCCAAADLEGANQPAHLEGTELERYVRSAC